MPTLHAAAPPRPAPARLPVSSRLAALTVLALLAGLLGLGAAPPAVADAGPAPAPRDITVLGKVHTDAVSTFLDGGELRLGTKADTPENGTRYAAEDVWFHVDDASRQTLPAGFEFIAPEGTQVWVAPEANPAGQQLWAGFSTEGVPAGAIANDLTTFTLVEARTPDSGSVEVYTGGGGLTPVTRLWSSDEEHRTFALGRVHRHANWAFTRPGRYELTVRAQATIGGSAVSDTATYTFYVGDTVPTPQATEVALAASAPTVAAGESVTLTADVVPAGADGYVELSDTTATPVTVLGHTEVVGGRASLSVASLALGERRLVARFVPRTSRHAATSTSDPVVVTVTQAPGDTTGPTLAFADLAAHYHQGRTVALDLVADPEPGPDDTVTWEWQWPGGDWAPLPGASGLSHRLTAEQALDGVRVRATLDAEQPVVAAPVTIHVDDHGDPALQVPTVAGASSYTAGESLALRRELPAGGPTVLTAHRWERRAAGAQTWTVLTGQVGTEVALPAMLADDGASYRVSIVKPGGAVAYGPSQPVTVSVVPETATELAIAGVETSYDVGDVLRARIVGHQLAEGQTWRWIIRPVGSSYSGYVLSGDGSATEVAQGRLRQRLDVQHDGYEIRARLRQGSAYVTGKDTAWVPLSVADGADPVTIDFPAGPHHLGEEIVVPLSRPLAAGESARLVVREDSPWFEVGGTTLRGGALVVRTTYPSTGEFAAQVLRDGLVVAMSPAVRRSIDYREVLVEGVRGVYRVGQTLSATAQVFPAVEGLTYVWETMDAEFNRTELKRGTSEDALTLDLPVDMSWDGKYLFFNAYAGAGTVDELAVGYWQNVLKVSDAAPDTQLLFFEGLGGHYHQGYDVNLNVVADPGLSDGDTLTWEWRWPGTDWAPFPGASGLSHHLVAEQALDGVEVRATLDYAAAGKPSVVSEPTTIHHDDHGSPARQQPTVTGTTSVVEGDPVSLDRVLPENGASVLTEHRWERRVGDGAWTVVAGATGERLSFPATAADHGAAYRVSLVKPGGAVAYGPSPEITLEVAARPAAATEVSVTPVRQVYGQAAELVVAVSGPATGAVSVRVGDQTLRGELTAGRATVVLPARALRPGTHPVSVEYAGAAGTFLPSTGTAEVRVAQARPRVTVRATRAVKRGQRVRVQVAVTADGVTPGGKVVVRVAGSRKAATLDARGRAVVRVAVRRSTRPGTKPVVVAYRGDEFVTAVPRTTAKVRVTR